MSAKSILDEHTPEQIKAELDCLSNSLRKIDLCKAAQHDPEPRGLAKKAALELRGLTETPETGEL